MSRDEARAIRDVELEKDRARYGLLAVVISNLAIAGVAIFGVWQFYVLGQAWAKEINDDKLPRVARRLLPPKRIKAMMIDGKKTFQIGIPIHWGYRGIKEDEGKTALNPANLLTPATIDPNAYTPEFKGFLVKLEKA